MNRTVSHIGLVYFLLYHDSGNEFSKLTQTNRNRSNITFFLCFNLFEYIFRCLIVFMIEPNQVRQGLKQQHTNFF